MSNKVDFIPLLKHIYISAIAIVLAFIITNGVCDEYHSKLHQTGDVVLAKDTVFLEYVPYFVGIIVLVLCVIFTPEPKE